ncbi:MAG: TonB-dependent receptor [Cytophagales bacterium]|nr:TonB-dependent receptor [Cytophagales bacterium]
MRRRKLTHVFSYVLGILCCSVGFYDLQAQGGTLNGRVLETLSKKPVPFVSLLLKGTSMGTITDENGYFILENVEPGVYSVEITCVGYEKQTKYDIDLSRGRVRKLDILLKPSSTDLEEISITFDRESFFKTDESPTSAYNIGVNEIRRMPGGNRDVSKVIRSLPGASSTPSFRNDIIIRGGSPSENSFYIEDIPLPVLNHFQTQGSSGGPQGILNVDLLSEVQFYSGAFPVHRGGAASSVFDFYYKEHGDRWGASLTQGASDFGLLIEGPTGDRSGLLFSFRRSYLQFLLPILKLPFIPTYNDLQFKYEHTSANEKHKLSLVGVGGLDDFALNEEVVDGITDPDEIEASLLILENVPINQQEHYTTGIKYEYFHGKGKIRTILSRSQLWNQAYKYQDNDESREENLRLNYGSQEHENHLRMEGYHVVGPWNLTYGWNYEYAVFSTDIFARVFLQRQVIDLEEEAKIDLHKVALFGQVSRNFFRKLTFSAGLRADDNNFTNPRFSRRSIPALSPRISASYQFNNRVSLNANAAFYHQLPPYTSLGYRERGVYVNQNENVDYFRSHHLVAGIGVTGWEASRWTLESFYKGYTDYPLSVANGVSLGNFGADFGVFGNEEIRSSAYGRSRGLEMLFQQKFYRGYYGLMTYTFFTAEFKSSSPEAYTPSSWDYRHASSIVFGKRFETYGTGVKQNWEIGGRWLYTGPTPYTPYDVDQSLLKPRWDVDPTPVLDYTQVNSLRSGPFHQLDLRVEYKLYFQRWTLTTYWDVQNVYAYRVSGQDSFTVKRDENKVPIEDPNRAGYYQPRYLPNRIGTLLPTAGMILEF